MGCRSRIRPPSTPGSFAHQADNVCHEDWVGSTSEARARRIPVEVAVSDGVLPGMLYEPHDTPSGGPVVLITDIYGTVPFYHEVSGRLAAAGHPTLLIDIFWREGDLAENTREAAFARRSGMDEPRGIADTSVALDFVKGRFGAEQAGVVGFCLGGLFAFVLAAQRDDLVTVSYYGFPEGISAPVRVPSPRPIDLVAEMTGPILSFWGEEDYIGVDVMNRFGDAVTAQGVDYEAHIYPDAGHAFLQGLVEDRVDSAAAADSWTRTLAYLNQRLPA